MIGVLETGALGCGVMFSGELAFDVQVEDFDEGRDWGMGSVVQETDDGREADEEDGRCN